MRRIQASEAKTHLPRLLDEVERGETLVITRHGKAVAHLVPAASRERERVLQALEAIATLRERTGKLSNEELLALRHEGHRY